MWLDKFDNRTFERGRPRWVEMLWIMMQALFVSSCWPGSGPRRACLRAFGARIGRGVVIKPRVRVKFPWRLSVGDHSWIGEGVWIDNLAEVRIGAHCCLSQNAYLCTGSHDWRSAGFDLITRPIDIQDQAWIAAQAVVGPGVTVGRGAVLALAAVAVDDLRSAWIYRGNPAQPVKPRSLNGAELQADSPSDRVA